MAAMALLPRPSRALQFLLHALAVRSLLAADTTAPGSFLTVRGKHQVAAHHDAQDAPSAALQVGAMKSITPWYHTSAELLSEAQRFVDGCNGRAKMEAHEKDGVTIHTVHINADNESPSNRLFMMFGEHARELISPETGLRLLETLCADAPTSSKVAPADVLRDNSFTLVLNANPRSRALVEQGDFCKRTNPNEVDLNRNWDAHWEPDSTVDGANTNPGPHPFSETETQILKSLLETSKPTTSVIIHSGTKGMYMPFAWSADLLEQDDKTASMMEVLRTLDKDHCQCPYGAAGKEVGYPAPGTSLDYARQLDGNYFSFAVEIAASHSDDQRYLQRYNEEVKEEAHAGAALLQEAHAGAALLQTQEHHHGRHRHARGHDNSGFLEKAEDQAIAQVSSDSAACFENYNPQSKEEYDSVRDNWAAALLELASLTNGELHKLSMKTGESLL